MAKQFVTHDDPNFVPGVNKPTAADGSAVQDDQVTGAIREVEVAKGRASRMRFKGQKGGDPRIADAMKALEGLSEFSTRRLAPEEATPRVKTDKGSAPQKTRLVPTSGSKAKREAANALLGRGQKPAGRSTPNWVLEHNVNQIARSWGVDIQTINEANPLESSTSEDAIKTGMGHEDAKPKSHWQARLTGGHVATPLYTEKELRDQKLAEARSRLQVSTKEQARTPAEPEPENERPRIPANDLIKKYGHETSEETISDDLSAMNPSYRRGHTRNLIEDTLHHLNQASLHKKSGGKIGTKLSAAQIDRLQNVYYNAGGAGGFEPEHANVQPCGFENKSGQRTCPHLAVGTNNDMCSEHGGKAPRIAKVTGLGQGTFDYLNNGPATTTVREVRNLATSGRNASLAAGMADGARER